jgi:hypothetical protein
MMRRRFAGLLLAVATLSATAPQAHHSFAQFDGKQVAQVQGTVKALQWTNPHVYLEVQVRNAAGEDELWLFESSSPNQLTRAGWSRHAISTGDQLSVEFHPLKSGKRGGWLIKCTWPDGRTLGG